MYNSIFSNFPPFLMWITFQLFLEYSCFFIDFFLHFVHVAIFYFSIFIFTKKYCRKIRRNEKIRTIAQEFFHFSIFCDSPLYFLENSSYTKNLFISNRRSIFNTLFRTACMHNCIISYVNCHMTTITYNVTRLHFRSTYLISHFS